MGNIRKVIFDNIQCINHGEIEIEEGKINIKYGFNGLGKSSIGKAIDYSVNDKKKFQGLKPFLSESLPSISIVSEPYQSVESFNAEYLDSFLLDNKSGQAIKDAYPVFFETERIANAKEKAFGFIDVLSRLAGDEIFFEFLSMVNELESAIALKKKGNGLSDTKTIGQYLKNDFDPSSLLKSDTRGRYQEYADSVKWMKWASDGKNILGDNKTRCPFCAQEFGNENEYLDNLKSDIDAIVEIVSTNDKVDNALKAQNVLTTLLNLATKEEAIYIEKAARKDPEYKEEQKLAIVSAFSRAIEQKNNLLFLSRKDFGIFNQKFNLEEMKERFSSSVPSKDYFLSIKINNSSLERMNKQIEKIESEITNLLASFDDFMMEMDHLQSEINLAVQESCDEMNNFLRIAGIPYVFHMDVLNEEARTYITPIGTDNEVSKPKDNLSFGERNSFALALFGAIAKRKNSELIILDDPVSSFDENKKYAVMHFLFNKTNGVLKDKTVLILTHDMEPVLDMFYKNLVKNDKCNASLLNKSDGIVSETKLTYKEITLAVNTELQFAQDETKDLYLRLVRLRRYVEMVDGPDNDVYYVLAALEKLYDTPRDYSGKHIKDQRLKDAESLIATKIGEQEFSYRDFIDSRNNINYFLNLYHNEMSAEIKLMIARPIIDLYNKLSNHSYKVDPTVMNFILQTYHVEAMDMYTISGTVQVPPYISRMVEEIIGSIESSL